jgi:hypothetical protein
MAYQKKKEKIRVKGNLEGERVVFLGIFFLRVFGNK